MYETEDANELDNDADYKADDDPNECFAEQDLDLDEWIDEYDTDHNYF